MRKTGESYSAARRHIIQKVTPRNSEFVHLPGNNPGTNALRVLLANHGGDPLTEAMAFGIAGGIGAGVFSFHYEQEDFVSFFVAGRHLWHDERAFLENALDRMGYRPIVVETGGAKAAASHLAQQIEEFGPSIVWVDSGGLPYRAVPEIMGGGGYHVVVVYSFNETDGALIGDLADTPFRVTAEELSNARARIKKDKNRILSIGEGANDYHYEHLIRAGIRACMEGLEQGRNRSFTLDAYDDWADRLHGSKAKDSWDRRFTPGKNLWQGLTSLYDFVEHYGTGGGLLRPLFGDFLVEAASLLGESKLNEAAALYTELGTMWTDLANSALPDEFELFAKAKHLLATKEELLMSEGEQVQTKIRDIWNELEALSKRAEVDFPLDESQAADLRADLKEKLNDILRFERDGVGILKVLYD
jgi:hypothetical protein